MPRENPHKFSYYAVISTTLSEQLLYLCDDVTNPKRTEKKVNTVVYWQNIATLKYKIESNICM